MLRQSCRLFFESKATPSKSPRNAVDIRLTHRGGYGDRLMPAREVAFISSTVGNWLHVDAEYDIRPRWIAIGSPMLCESAQCYLIWNDAALDRSNRS